MEGALSLLRRAHAGGPGALPARVPRVVPAARALPDPHPQAVQGHRLAGQAGAPRRPGAPPHRGLCRVAFFCGSEPRGRGNWHDDGLYRAATVRQPLAFAGSSPVSRMLKTPTTPVLRCPGPGWTPSRASPVPTATLAGATAPCQPGETTGDAGFDPLKPHPRGPPPGAASSSAIPRWLRWLRGGPRSVRSRHTD